ncbi:MAG: UvrD-helicase domain-containing protein [Bacteroidales bacterium]|nr:UvrD-helicase domain-containing protein [Bacteroidales bacterium]
MFKTYSASAGSGKTFSLVVNYLTLCFRNLCDSHNQQAHSSREIYQKILAMTFTNNAAAEMKTRIMEVLKEIAFTDPASPLPNYQGYYQTLVQKIFQDKDLSDMEIRRIMQEAAQRQLQAILYDYDRFSVTTIDSFYQSVIRASALRLGLDLNYTVEIDLNEFYAQVVEQVVDNLKKEDDFSQLVVSGLNNEMEDTGKTDVNTFLLSTLKLLYGKMEENYDYLEALQHMDKGAFEKQILEWRRYLANVRQTLRTTMKDRFQNMVNALDKATDYHKNTYNRVVKWKNNPLNLLEEYDATQSCLTRLLDKKYLNQKGSIGETSEKIIEKEAGEIKEWLDQNAKKYFNTRLLVLFADKLLIIFDIQQKMEELKALRGLFFLAESNIILHRELARDPHADPPAIYEKNGFHYFFLDEFQDTSKMQWHNLKPLIENNAISSDGDVFLFGDVKQAIYRWRNGDAQILRDLSDFKTQNDHGHGFVNLSEDRMENVPLNRNFRTLKSVVGFNNQFFTEYAKAVGCSDLYADIEQKAMKSREGLVQVFFYEDKKPRQGLVEPPLTGVHAVLDDYLRNDSDQVDARNKEVLYALRDALSRGYDCGDIMILARANDDLEAMAQLLIEIGLPAKTKKSLSLKDAPEVMAIVNTLALLDNPDNQIAQATVLYALSQVHSWPDILSENLLSLTQGPDVFKHILRERLACELPVEVWREESLYVMVPEIIRLYKLDQKPSLFVHEFLDFVLDYLSKRKDDVKSFLEHWDFLIMQGSIPDVQAADGKDAISLMTIHTSKGLERPVVIYVPKAPREHPVEFWTYDNTDANGERVAYLSGYKKAFANTDFETECQSRDLKRVEDELNTYYVAHTRPRDMLYIVSKFKEEKTSNKPNETDAKVDYFAFLQQFVLRSSHFKPHAHIPNVYCCGDEHHTKKEEDNGGSEVQSIGLPPLTISDFTVRGMRPVYPKQSDDARAEGTRVHDCLARMLAFPQDEAAIEKVSSEIPEEIRPTVTDLFRHILADEEIRPFFGPAAKVHNETPILSADGDERRPDRVAFLGEQVRVFDYKTGSDNPDDYDDQVRSYCQMIREMGYQDVEGYLIFLDPYKVRRVPMI